MREQGAGILPPLAPLDFPRPQVFVVEEKQTGEGMPESGRDVNDFPPCTIYGG